MSHPAAPVEVSRLVLDARYPTPHWLAADRGSSRLVVTGDPHSWILIVDLDPETGALTVDEAFREAGATHPRIDFNRTRWPHGETGGAVLHGVVFEGGSPPSAAVRRASP